MWPKGPADQQSATSCTLHERISSCATLPFISGMISQQKISTHPWVHTDTRTRVHAITLTLTLNHNMSSFHPLLKFRKQERPHTHTHTHTAAAVMALEIAHFYLWLLLSGLTSAPLKLPITKAVAVEACCRLFEVYQRSLLTNIWNKRNMKASIKLQRWEEGRLFFVVLFTDQI